MPPVAATALGEARTKPAAMSDADPIFAAIEQHKEARAYLAAMDVHGEDREIRAAEDACQQAEHDAFYELIRHRRPLSAWRPFSSTSPRRGVKAIATIQSSSPWPRIGETAPRLRTNG